MRTIACDYHQQRRGNCAQSVAHAWAAKHPAIPGPRAEAYAGCGAGRAPGGLCGALHASCELAGAAAAEAIQGEFAEKTGGLMQCRAIRASKALSCNECVGLAADLLDKHGPQA